MKKINEKNIFKKIKESLFQNLKIKLLCFFLGTMMYIFTSIFQRETVVYTVPLKLENLKDYYVIKNNLPDYVKIVAKDKPSTFSKINENDFKVRLDLSIVDKPDTYTIPIKWEIPSEIKSLFASIKIEPSEFEIQIERKKEKRVKVEINTIGEPANGYMINKIIIDPPFVRIQGPESLINKISSVKTEPINIDGIKESFSTNVKAVSEYQSIKVLNQINISFEIIEEFTSSNFKLNKFTFLNLNSELEARALEEITITLKGPKNQLSNLDVNDYIFAYFDCSYIKYPGVYKLPVYIKNNSPFNLINLYPELIDIVIELKR